MLDSTVTSKGQTTVPIEVRNAIKATPGAKLRWHVMPDGSVVVRAKNRSVLDLAGMLKPTEGGVPVTDMNAWR